MVHFHKIYLLDHKFLIFINTVLRYIRLYNPSFSGRRWGDLGRQCTAEPIRARLPVLLDEKFLCYLRKNTIMHAVLKGSMLCGNLYNWKKRNRYRSEGRKIAKFLHFYLVE